MEEWKAYGLMSESLNNQETKQDTKNAYGFKRKKRGGKGTRARWADREEGDELTISCAIHFPNH